MKIIYSALIFLLIMMVLPDQVIAQRGQGQRPDLKVKGKVVEGPSKLPMIGANVMIKTVADSILVSTVTDIDGNFELSRPWVPTVIVEVSFLGFEKFTKELGMRDELDLGIIALREDSKLLGEVVIEGQIIVGEQKGDTTSFNANAFKTRENADAEDLIRKLPGVTIQNGQVQARGEQVQKVLVDGREFFGNDPFLAMRNLPADVIDRVEILDQRSDQSRLTGFDDGNYSRTINIVTRSDRRQGVFGRVYAGYGTDDRYSAGGSVNIFKGDRRVSLVGLFNNINQQNFSQEDLGGGTGGGGRPGGGGRGGVPNFGGGQDNGIITTNSMGINYSDKWGTKTNVTGSYFYSRSRNNLSSFTNREILLSETNSQFYTEDLINTVESGNHRANARIEYDINPKNALIISPSLNYTTNNTFSDRDALTVNNLFDPLSSTRSISDAESSSINFSNNLVYRYKFEKQGRTLSTSLFTAINNRDSYATLYAVNRDFIRNIGDTINQETLGLTEGFNYRANMQWTEPLNTTSLLTFSYQVANNKSSADQQTFNIIPELNAVVLDTALSNVFDNRFLVQNPSIGYRYNYKNWNVNANLDYQYAQQDNEAIFPQVGIFNRTFSNFLPGVNLNYRNSEKGTTFRMRYRTSTQEPSVNQLQNVINNSNPLNLSVGNPNLGQSFNHNLFVNVGKLNLEKSRTFFVFAFASLTENFIGNSTFVTQVDTLINDEVLLRPGGQLSRPENLGGRFNGRVFATYGAPIKGIKSQFNSNTSVSFNRTPGIINGQRNLNDNIDLSQGVTLTSNISKDFDFTLSTTGTYTIVNSSLQTSLNNNYYVQNSNIRLYYSPNNGKLFVSNVVNNALYRGLSAGLDQSVWLWNIEGGYRFLKNNKGEVKVTVFDLLGQNNAIARTINDVSITDTFTRVLTRYALLTFTYHIGSFKQPERNQSQQGGPGMRMMQGGRSW
ncbi:outer membrane beta-barrel protein [Belliella sp. DSM 111904]|uniref:Outer membrane beta-barrel protein n=1 Tax=Belliella filtrata TaxID=2923435 RepID=A0ABS9UV06_9BACT|nr:TonB-dependent receptor [Belliella filtrata]MCH7408005.1 outer membrane beta-barrel protein [Belliella filtrata]